MPAASTSERKVIFSPVEHCFDIQSMSLTPNCVQTFFFNGEGNINETAYDYFYVSDVYVARSFISCTSWKFAL